VTLAALVLLGAAAALGAVLLRRTEAARVPRGREIVLERPPRPVPWGALVLVGLVAAAAALAWAAVPPTPWLRSATGVAAVLAAGFGGGPVVVAVLAAADPTRAVSALAGRTAGATASIADPDVLRGGSWIGFLERLALAATLLAGWPEGLPVVLAVKGLGRFQALKETPAAERFIIGTLASVLWAAACAGVAVLART
jgi:hypothetical protein